MKALKRYFYKPQVALLRINGPINIEQTAMVHRYLKKVDLTITRALAVVVNSSGGSPAQCDLIAGKIRSFKHKTNIPVLTFAEELAVSGGYYILSVGDQVCADSTAEVGGVCTLIDRYNWQDLVDKFKLEAREFTSEETLISKRLNPHKNNLRPEDRKVVSQILTESDDYFKAHVDKARGNKSMKAGSEHIEALTGRVFLGKDAVNNGLADEIGSYESIIYQKFPKTRIIELNEKPKWQTARYKLKNLIKFVTSKNFPILITGYILYQIISTYLMIVAAQAASKAGSNQDKSNADPSKK